MATITNSVYSPTDIFSADNVANVPGVTPAAAPIEPYPPTTVPSAVGEYPDLGSYPYPVSAEGFFPQPVVFLQAGNYPGTPVGMLPLVGPFPASDPEFGIPNPVGVYPQFTEFSAAEGVFPATGSYPGIYPVIGPFLGIYPSGQAGAGFTNVPGPIGSYINL